MDPLFSKTTRGGHEILRLKPALTTNPGATLLDCRTYEIVDGRFLQVRDGIFLKQESRVAIVDILGVDIKKSFGPSIVGFGASDLQFRDSSGSAPMIWQNVRGAEEVRDFILALKDEPGLASQPKIQPSAAVLHPNAGGNLDELSDVVVSVPTCYADQYYGTRIWQANWTPQTRTFQPVAEYPQYGSRVRAGMPLLRVLGFECFVRCPFDGVFLDNYAEFTMRPSRDAWERHIRESVVVERVPPVVFGDVVRYVRKIEQFEQGRPFWVTPCPRPDRPPHDGYPSYPPDLEGVCEELQNAEFSWLADWDDYQARGCESKTSRVRRV